MQNKGEFGTAANHFVSALYHEALNQGVDVERLLQSANIHKDVIDRPEKRIPTELLAAFQKNIWDEMQDESMGLFAYKLPAGTYFMMGKLTVHEPNLSNALELGVRFYNLVTQSQFMQLHTEGDNTVLSIGQVDPQIDKEHLFAEIALLAWHRYASWLIADNLPLTETRFNYLAPSHANEYPYLFPGIHKFGHKSLSLVFPSDYLSRPIKQNEAILKSFMKSCPLELFRQYKADYSVSAEVKRIINSTLFEGNISIDDVAARLYMTTRTIMRRLKDEGASFQQIKDLVRRDKAINLLTHYSLPIKEVAERIGYSDPAVFARAFRSWTGESPRKYRRNIPISNDK